MTKFVVQTNRLWNRWRFYLMFVVTRVPICNIQATTTYNRCRPTRINNTSANTTAPDPIIQRCHTCSGIQICTQPTINMDTAVISTPRHCFISHCCFLMRFFQVFLLVCVFSTYRQGRAATKTAIAIAAIGERNGTVIWWGN